jgi:plasmid stabilization system protein ParE
MAFHVELAESARADAERLYERVTAAAPYRGPIWYRRLMLAIQSLRNNPERCPVAPRQLLFGKKPHVYRVLHELRGNTVYVLHIVHGAREHFNL